VGPGGHFDRAVKLPYGSARTPRRRPEPRSLPSRGHHQEWPTTVRDRTVDAPLALGARTGQADGAATSGSQPSSASR
jgi:hypothetical protein